MDKSYELKYHRLEENNWWFISRRDLILRLIKQSGFNKRDNILEIGCSGGALIRTLKRNDFNIVSGIDISKSAVELCKKRKIKNIVRMDGEMTTFKDNTFDLIIASDVLEHIKNDKSALFDWNRILRSNGKLILFVPAFNFLWSEHDDINNHYRRYSKLKLIKKLKESGFEIQQFSSWNIILFMPILILRIFQKIFQKNKDKPKDQLYELNPILNNFLIRLLKMENRILNFINFPIGISFFAICRKKSNP